MYAQLINKEIALAVIGLGYVGLPLALAFAKKFKVIGFDHNEARVNEMKKGKDPSHEVASDEFLGKDIVFSAAPEDIAYARFYVVAVPTPVDENKSPDLQFLHEAAETIGKLLKKGDYVVFESTVYPGCTEEECLPLLEKHSGLKLNKDFKIGYSPERISPGDKARTIDKINKVVSGSDEESLKEIRKVYEEIINAEVYPAPCIKVAEAAKIIENTQRDLNISLMNELAVIFDKLDIDTQEVIKAASTKWNFMKFYPGLVGGHCIGVDPYYLLHKAKQVGYDPQVILSGRRINDRMPQFVAEKLVKILIQADKTPQETKVLVMGITFKENVADIRNSKVADLIKELMSFSITVHMTDPHACADEVAGEYGLHMTDKLADDYDAIIVAVNHKEYYNFDLEYFKSISKKGNPILIDLKGIYETPESDFIYWRL